MNIYIVIGSTGCYSDFNEWPVAAWMNKEKAVEHADNALKRGLQIEKEIEALDGFDGDYDTWRAGRYKIWARQKDKLEKSNQYDQEMNGYDGDINYYVWTVEIRE